MIKAPNYNYWNIFRYLKSQYPNKKTAIFSSWLDNRTKLVGEGMPAAGGIYLDYHLDSLELDTIRFPHDQHTPTCIRLMKKLPTLQPQVSEIRRRIYPGCIWSIPTI